MLAPTLDGRLLCASAAAYAITGDMKTLAPDPKNVYLNGAGFVGEDPSVFTAGTDAIDGCLVGEMADGLVLAFRGTMPLDFNSPPSVADWVSDFHADPVAMKGFPGFVHAGFSGALTVLWPSITDELQRRQSKAPTNRPILITGHSKGGAMAGLAAWSLQGIAGTPVKVVTFAAAKPGDAGFRTGFESAGIDHTRYEYNIDIVPHLPLSDGGFIDVLAKFPLKDLPWFNDLFADVKRFDYQPVGTLQYIESNGQIVGDSDALRRTRDQALTVEILRFQFKEIAMNHAIGCGFGYMSAVVPTGVCPPPPS